MINNVVIGSGGQQRALAIHMHVRCFFYDAFI